MGSTREIIAQLKEVRKEKGYSYQYLVDATEANGEAVSMSTIKRMFGEDSDLYDFRYATSIQPVARVLLGIADAENPEDQNDNRQSEKDHATIEAMKNVIVLKNEMLEDIRGNLAAKTSELEASRQAHKEEIAALKAEHHEEMEKKVTYLKDLISSLKNDLRYYRCIVFVLVAIIIGVLAVDLMVGTVGWFRY